MSHAFQAEIAFLGIASSPSFARGPEGNGVAERFIRTRKEQLLWAQTFDTVEALRRALLDFKIGSTNTGYSGGTAMLRLNRCGPPVQPWR